MKSNKKIVQGRQFDKNTPIEFFRIENTLEIFDFDHHYQYDFYQIYWFKDVSNHYHEIDFVRYPIVANEIWILYPGQVHYLDPSTIKGYCLAINKDYFHSVLFNEAKMQIFTGHSHLKFDVTPALQQVFEHLHLLMEIEFGFQKRTTVLEKYLQLYIVYLQDLPLVYQDHITIDFRIHRLLELIEQHYITERKNTYYADKIALSPKRMNEILLRTTSKTLKQQLQDRLLLEAKRLVGYSDENIQDIAYKLKFSDVSYFNRFFKKLTEYTPSDFREKVKKSK